MVVVAIIGILSAVAIPNFKQYQAKSKQSEAKIQLAAVYTVETGSQADYDGYATCLKDLGYEVTPRGYYTISTGTADFLTPLTNRSVTCASGTLFAPSTALKANTGAASVTDAITKSITPTSSTFQAGAAGNIASSNTANDAWTIDQVKTLTNTTQVLK